jgi:hypothetical protein
MIRDFSIPRRTEALTEADRRRTARVPFPVELVVLWHHDLTEPVRYQVVDAGDGGFRVRTSTPIQTGTTGTALTLLPEGHPVDKSVMVVWCGHNEPKGGYEVGLRFF